MRVGRRVGPFPNHIRAIREDRGMTQKELSSAAGVERSWLSRIESGAAIATGQQLDAIAKALHSRPATLYEPNFLSVIYDSPEVAL